MPQLPPAKLPTKFTNAFSSITGSLSPQTIGLNFNCWSSNWRKPMDLPISTGRHSYPDPSEGFDEPLAITFGHWIVQRPPKTYSEYRCTELLVERSFWMACSTKSDYIIIWYMYRMYVYIYIHICIFKFKSKQQTVLWLSLTLTTWRISKQTDSFWLEIQAQIRLYDWWKKK